MEGVQLPIVQKQLGTTVPIFDMGGTTSIPDQSPAACFSGPMLDLWSGPQANAALTELDDRPGHIGIAVQIRCDAVPVRQSQQARDAVCIDEVINVDPPAHLQSLHMLTDPPG